MPRPAIPGLDIRRERRKATEGQKPGFERRDHLIKINFEQQDHLINIKAI